MVKIATFNFTVNANGNMETVVWLESNHVEMNSELRQKVGNVFKILEGIFRSEIGI